MIPIPQNFDGTKFANKFHLTPADFYISDGYLYCPSLPNLSEIDIADCIVDLAQYQRIQSRLAAAEAAAKAIPNWASWTQADWQNYFDTQLSDAQVDLVTSLAIARTAMKRQNLVILNLVKMLIALRDQTWPDLPE